MDKREEIVNLSRELMEFLSNKDLPDSMFIMGLGNAFLNALCCKMESSIRVKEPRDVQTTVEFIEETQDALIDLKIKAKIFLGEISNV